jgi:diguanylate cyclase (GGDEF)-like protein
MKRAKPRHRSLPRLFAVYAAITLVPVVVLGVILAITFQGDANARGLAQGRSEAMLIAQTAVEPQLDSRPLSAGLTPAEHRALARLTRRAVQQHHILRLRLRDLAGRVVFSDDGSGFGEKPEDEALDAADGETIVRLTHLNADTNDHGRHGVAAVEVYLPLSGGTLGPRTGVLEIYLPYSPIAADATAGLHGLYLDLIGGLAALYVLLFAITLSASRGLRREVAVNAFLANHDTLTDLPNRALFLTRAKAAVLESSRSPNPTAIAIIDLDHFKDINDTLGHQSGDELLMELAARVSANMRAGDTVSRLGGDEFGLILRDVADAEQALLRLRDVIAHEVEVRGLALSVAPSIGFVTAIDATVEVDTLVQYAEVAMYAAKTRHAGVLQYDADLDQYDAGNLALAAELRHAIDRDQLVLHYQPQCDPGTGRVRAIEALVRWQHPTHGLVGPDRFLPLAEQTDLIDRLTTWVLETALRAVRDLTVPDADLTIAVNVSPRSLIRPDFAQSVLDSLAACGVPPERLVIEVTETALLTDPVRAAITLSHLGDAGVAISLDDFGRGQTSLGYLSSLPIHELKVDRSFVTDMRANATQAAIVRSIIDLGHNLSMRVVAEGIETSDVLTMLSEYGCDLAQGYYLARPMPIERLTEWLAQAHQPGRARSSTITG